MATTAIIPLHAGKGRAVAAALKISVNYVKNPDKTDAGERVTSYECDPLIADDEFMFSKNQYAAITGRSQGERDVIAYHLRISFKPGETDAATANKIGYDLAMKLTHGNHAFVCCSHTDKAHTHCHAIINSTSLDCTKKFRNFKGSSFAIRRIADKLCIENGLSIVENPKLSKGRYTRWDSDNRPPTNCDRLRDIIDTIICVGMTFFEFIAALIKAGCTVKQGKHIAMKIPGAKKNIRLDSLDDDYTEAAIKERLSVKRIVAPREKTSEPKTDISAPLNMRDAPNLVVDIQEKMRQGKGEGYRNWATTFNLKQSAKTLIFLKDNDLADYDKLVGESNLVSAEYNRRLARLKEIEPRMKEISTLQRYISQYGKTREVYKQYKASNWSKKYLDEHESEIILHRAAKKYFDELGLKKLPKMADLKQEWAMLNAEKNKLYSGYKELKEKRMALLTARANTENLLGINKKPPHQLDSSRAKNRGNSHEI